MSAKKANIVISLVKAIVNSGRTRLYDMRHPLKNIRLKSPGARGQAPVA
jgi:hypothetical protein